MRAPAVVSAETQESSAAGQRATRVPGPTAGAGTTAALRQDLPSGRPLSTRSRPDCQAPWATRLSSTPASWKQPWTVGKEISVALFQENRICKRGALGAGRGRSSQPCSRRVLSQSSPFHLRRGGKANTGGCSRRHSTVELCGKM